MNHARIIAIAIVSTLCLGRSVFSQATESPDLVATIEQSAADKFVHSVEYPFTVIDRTYPPFSAFALTENESGEPVDAPDADFAIGYEPGEREGLVRWAYNIVHGDDGVPAAEKALAEGIIIAATDTVEALRRCIRAHEEAERDGRIAEWGNGVDIEQVRELLRRDPGLSDVEYLVQITAHWELKPHLRWLRITVSNEPSVQLNGPVVSVSTNGLRAGATGELWAHVKFPKCRRWCTKWEWYWKWIRLGSLTLRDVRFHPVEVDIHAHVRDLTFVELRALFRKLRLDYPILRKIPLEKYPNKAVGNKALLIYDAASYLATVPVLDSTWRVKFVRLPKPSPGRIKVEIGIKQVE